MGFRARLILLGLSGLLGAVLVGVFSLVVQSRLGALVEAQAMSTQALRNQIEADMMHDAVKADLYEALHARAIGDDEKLAGAHKGLGEHVAWFRRAMDANARMKIDPEVAKAIAKVRPVLDTYIATVSGLMAQLEAGEAQPDLSAFDQAYDALAGEMEAVSDKIGAVVTDNAKAAASARDSARYSISVLLIASVVVLLSLAFWITRTLLRTLGGEPADAAAAAESIASGNMQAHIAIAPGDTGSLMAKLASMRDQLRDNIERERTAAVENLRLRHALDSASSATMVADRERRIIFVNRAVVRILKQAEDDLRQVYTGFSADRLVGESIDQFHRNPQHQRDLLEHLTEPYSAQIRVGGHDFRLRATPIFDDQRQRIGTTVDWEDCTAELLMQREVAGIVAAAAQGDFDGRIALDGKEGFFRDLSEAVNALLERTIVGITEVKQVLHGLGEGNLTSRSRADLAGVFGAMRDDANRTAETLQRLMLDIRDSADEIHSASGEIAHGNADLSSRTEQQAASLEEAAASMEELTTTVKQNAEAAHEANRLSAEAAKVAEQAGTAVSDVVRMMDRIETTSRKVGEIVSTIDSIAFQTNILALNAAVEAARAGEQGRGFAVVASEVRALARRAGDAAKEIHGLIGESVRQVTEGTEVAHRAGGTMGSVVQSVHQVTGIMAEISSATTEQARGIDLINQMVSSMETTTQQNAALVEQASAAASSMDQQAADLRNVVGRFRLA